MIGRCVEMNTGIAHVPHLVVAEATDEQLLALAISNPLRRRWWTLLNLETGRTDVWIERDISDAGYWRGWLL